MRVEALMSCCLHVSIRRIDLFFQIPVKDVSLSFVANDLAQFNVPMPS